MLNKNKNLSEIQGLADQEKMITNDLRLTMEAAISNRYVTLEDQAELHAYVVYMTYRIQQDLFAVCQENGQFRDLTWDGFVLLMREYEPARMAAVVVARETLKSFYRDGHYNFDVTEVKFKYGADADGGEDDLVHCANLFPDEEGLGLVQNLLFHAELEQFACQLNQRTGRSWNQFLDELEQKGPLWIQVLSAFKDALARLDFKPLWRSETLEELVRQAEAQEE